MQYDPTKDVLVTHFGAVADTEGAEVATQNTLALHRAREEAAKQDKAVFFPKGVFDMRTDAALVEPAMHEAVKEAFE